MPRFHRPLHKTWKPGRTTGPRVVLLAETFTDHNDPHVGLAVCRVIEALGYQVDLVPCDDLARAMISVGMLDDARRSIAATASRLAQLVTSDDTPVIVIEPSCLSALTDDWPKLNLHGHERTIDRLASVAQLPESFVESAWDSHPLHPSVTQPPGHVLFHGHCHQKALWGADSSTKLLVRLFGDRVRALETGCCGMAGSFGYASDKYDLSMKIGELTLFPAVRKAGPNDVVVAPGTSCRHQIADGTGVSAIHPMELIAGLLKS